MGDDSGYTTLTRYISVDFFKGMIESNIKKLIHTYGHKDCGLRQEELCNKIKNIISDNKKMIYKHMNAPSMTKWSNEWNRERSKYFNKLYEEEGFINMCFPTKYKNNPSLDQLLSKHIQFCKEKDVKREAVEKNPEFSECRNYNSWIETEKKLFTLEYLKNVKHYKHPNVIKYFSTKEHPEGHDPLKTYLNSKLDCNLYNPPPKSHPKGSVEKTPTSSLRPPTTANVKQGLEEKNGRSVPDLDSGSAKKELDANISPKSKHLIPNSQKYSPSQTQPGATPTIQDISLIPKAPVSTDSSNGKKQDATPIEGQSPTNKPPSAQAEAPPQAKSPSLPPNDTSSTSAIQIVPVTTATTSPSSTLATVKDTTSSQTISTSPSLTTSASSLNSDSPSPSDPYSPAGATKDQNIASHSTTTSDTLVTKDSTKTIPAPSDVVSLLAPPQLPTKSTPPAVTSAQGPATPESSSASTVTITTTVPPTTTNTTMSTAQNPLSSSNEPPGAHRPQKPPLLQVASEPKATEPNKDPHQTSLSSHTPLANKVTEAKSAADASPKAKGAIQATDNPLSKDTQQASENTSKTHVTIPDSNVQSTPNHRDQQISRTAVQQPSNIGLVLSPSDKTGHAVNTPVVHTNTPSMVDSTVRTNKNDNTSIIPEGIPPLTHIIPTLLVILGTLTLLFQLYKYTPFGFLIGRRRKRKKRDLRRTFKIPEKPTYESPNITVHEWEDPNLVGQTVENDVYTKSLKINRYKQEMQKRKKENKKTLIEVHMEVLEEYKSDEWELHKGDFLEICLRGLINEENDNYSKLPNSELTVNNTNKDKTIEDIQKQEILWNNWIEDYRNILEQWKKEEWFHILKNKWRNEEKKCKEKNDKLQENILNEQDTYSIVSQKEIWKQWISKQASLIKMFKQEDWFKELVDEQNKEKNNYNINEYNNISVTNKTELKNEKMNHEHCKSKNIIQKLMVQIHMMILEECIKDEIIRNKELCIDNFIEDIHNQNNYDQKRNITQCDTDNFNVLKYDEIHTSKNK
ncbi:STP1 protein [Plasmodium ovale wallikeri]|uniref:STP1 protein n=1 Tax=Plasmodium ovale wallikeri TaxID=864142 RepID=A0A1A9AQK0_PLAOA|nr:STP1 protein [Plasmodium ovale wallikeri]